MRDKRRQAALLYKEWCDGKIVAGPEPMIARYGEPHYTTPA